MSRARLGLLAAAIGIVGAGAALRGRSDDDEDDDGEVHVSSNVNKVRLWTQLLAIGELDDTQRGFLMICAGGETAQTFNPLAHNDSTSEVSSSVLATNNNPAIVARAERCGVARAKLMTGSWGMFQRLAPYLAGDAFEIFGNESASACSFADPTRVGFHFQIASAIETARDLQAYGGFQAHPTVGNLRLGWYSPGRMGYLSDNADRIARYRRQAAETGYPRSFVDARIRRFPANVASILGRMLQGGI